MTIFKPDHPFETILQALILYCITISKLTGRTLFRKTITMEDLNTLHISEAQEDWILDYLEKAGFVDSKFNNVTGGFDILIDVKRFPDIQPVVPNEMVLVERETLTKAASVILDSATVIKTSDYKISGGSAAVFSLQSQANLLRRYANKSVI